MSIFWERNNTQCYGRVISKETQREFVEMIEKNGNDIVPDYYMDYYRNIDENYNER